MKQLQGLFRRRLIRYLISGIISFGVENILFVGFYYGLALMPKTANILSFSIGLCANFLLTRFFVFRHRSTKTKAHGQAVRFAVLAVCNLTVSTYGVSTLIHAHVPGLLAKPLMTLVIASWNYILYRTIIFKSAEPPLAD